MPPLLVDLIHARACKPFCEKSLTLPFGEKTASTPLGYPRGENLWAATFRLIVGEETLDFRLL